MNLDQIIVQDYLPYAKNIIVERALCYIDGFKPVQRRILYDMNNLGLLGSNAKRAKCARIVGDTMGKYHPHGDSSIYDALVMLSTGYNALNVPFIDSNGNFGNIYDKRSPAKMRYTEARLGNICSEIFDGIKENAVEFRDNFDGTEKEPCVLPVKFPSILTSATAGVAVGTSSNIPSFALKNVCLATIGVINGSIVNASQLAEVLGTPVFTTGAYIHSSKELNKQLCETGKATYALTGNATLYSNEIVFTEIPYGVKAEDLEEQIVNAVKEGKIKEITDVIYTRDKNGFKMNISLKKSASAKEVIKKLCVFTDFRTKISFRTRFIMDGKCVEMGLLELIKTWIDFRSTTIKNIYEFRLNKKRDREELLRTWELINGRIKDVVDIIADNNEEAGKEKLKNTFSLNDVQIEYLYNFRLKDITTEKAVKYLNELAEVRKYIVDYTAIVSDENKRKEIIVQELSSISEKYKFSITTKKADMLTEKDERIEKEAISDELVRVVVTKSGCIRRLIGLNNINNYDISPDDPEVKNFAIRNNEYILVFTTDGEVHKVLTDSIDASRGLPKERLYAKLGLTSNSNIIWIDAAGDYTKYFNLVYNNGKGERIYYSRAQGNRSKYRSLYDPFKPGEAFVTNEDKFFVLTRGRKASYINLESLGAITQRKSFRAARMYKNDKICYLQEASKVPDIKSIDVSRYNKEYTVSINDDKLW